jgi:Carboxypeptidase regulatory-like domain
MAAGTLEVQRMNFSTGSAFLATALLTSSLFAQGTGAIAGTILSLAGAGARVSKASVEAKNTGTGVSYSARSGADGTYALPGIPPGNYELSVAAPPYFLPFSRKGVQVEAGKTLRIDVRLDDVTLNTLGDGGEQFADRIADKPAPSGPAPRTRDGKPDLSGVWLGALPTPVGAAPEPLPGVEAVMKARGGDKHVIAPWERCLPAGLSLEGAIYPFRLVQTSNVLAIIDEDGDPPRQIYLDGRNHPQDPNPSYMGHSVGRWQGDTLVVDSVGFNDRIWLSPGNYPQTEQMHITERFRRPDLGHLEVEMSFDDPGTFKKPWTKKRVNSLAPDGFELFEYVCDENNRDIGHLEGK